MAEAEGRGESGGGAAEGGVREAVGRLGISVGGWDGPLAGDFAEAKREQYKERKGSGDGAGSQELVLVMKRRRGWRGWKLTRRHDYDDGVEK